jgi:hypothetical protein
MVQKLKSMASRISIGVGLAQNVSRDTGKSITTILFDMMLCWIRKKINPTDYCMYKFVEKSWPERNKYLSQRELDVSQLILNPKDKVRLVDDKILFSQKCASAGLPTPRILCCINTERSPAIEGMKYVNNAHELVELFNNYHDNRILFKPIDSAGGSGIFVVKKNSRESLCDLDGTVWDANKLFEHCRKGGRDSYGKMSRGFMLQEFLEPHENLMGLMPGPGLGTLRIISVLTTSMSVEFFAACLRLPKKGNITDNLVHGRTGNLVALVDVISGRVLQGWTIDYSTRKTIKLDKHPDTGAAFIDFNIPNWSGILDILRDAARTFNDLKTIGWDVAVTQNGVYIIEANWHYSHDILQLVLDRGIKEELTQLFLKNAAFKK